MSKTTAPSRVIDPVIDYTQLPMHPDLMRLCKAEAAATKEASKNGEPIPARPAIEELQRRQADMTSTRKTKKATGTRTKGRTDIRYFHDGRSMSEGHKSKLSTVAYFYSFDLDGNKPRIGTAEFVAVLKKCGIDTPHEPGWMVKLPNGVTIECRKEDAASQFKGEPVTRKASKATAKKATAKKATGTTSKSTKVPASLKAGADLVNKPSTKKPVKGPKEPAGRARADARATKATRQVTPIPKGQPVKKAAPKKAVAAKATRRTARK